MRKHESWRTKFDRLLGNSRFWILTGGITLSVLIAGFIQLYVPGGSLQTIRIEQWYGFTSILLVYLAVLASPLTKVFPKLFFKDAYIHARRAIGVTAFYYALLHSCVTFFGQLDGFAGIAYYDTNYRVSLAAGGIALVILFIMAATSMDWIVDAMKFKNWKLLHRLVYIACAAILVHIVTLGPHYEHVSFLSGLTYIAVAFLVVLEIIRIYRVGRERKQRKEVSK